MLHALLRMRATEYCMHSKIYSSKISESSSVQHVARSSQTGEKAPRGDDRLPEEGRAKERALCQNGKQRSI